MTWRERLRSLVDSDRFQRFIIAVIVVNAVTLGLETSDRMVAEYGWLLHAVDRIALAIFVVELMLRLTTHGWRFFRDPWSVFDFIIVGIALVPTSGAFSVLRALRILRVLRLVALAPSMRGVVAALLTAIPGMASIAALLGLLLYIAAVIATQLFGNGGRNPDPYPSGAGTVIRAGTGTPKSRATTSLTDCTPSASVPRGSTWYMTAIR